VVLASMMGLGVADAGVAIVGGTGRLTSTLTLDVTESPDGSVIVTRS
jgi:hypothetical protein